MRPSPNHAAIANTALKQRAFADMFLTFLLQKQNVPNPSFASLLFPS